MLLVRTILNGETHMSKVAVHSLMSDSPKEACVSRGICENWRSCA
jgi:hypothetical protein